MTGAAARIAALAAALGGACGGGDGDDGADAAGGADGGAPPPCPPGAVRLELVAPAVTAAGELIPVLVRARDGERIDQRVSGPLALTAEGPGGVVTLDPSEVLLRRGAGAALVRVGAAGPFELRVAAPALCAQAVVAVGADLRPRRRPSGTLGGPDLAWGPDEIVELAADTAVPAGATLTIAPGTDVRLGARVNLLVAGEVAADGTADAPIVVRPLDPAAPWGGVEHAGAARWRHALFWGGGGDDARSFGHSASQPVLFAAHDAALALDRCVIQDAPGKALGGDHAVVTVTDSLVTRTDTGGQLDDGQLTVTRSHFLDFPGEGAPPDEDNDGLYLNGGSRWSLVADSVFVSGRDDGIDQNGANLRVERAWIQGFAHEGIAASNGGDVEVADSVIVGCDQGIEAGYGSPRVTARHVLLLSNHVGVRYGDSYDWEVTGTLAVETSVFLGNDTAVRNWVNGLGGPRPDAVGIAYSLAEEPLPGATNLTGAAVFTPDLLLAPGSPGRGAAPDGGDLGLLTPTPAP